MEAYGWLALVPPVLAIVLAIWTRQVIVSLFLGIFAGATIIAGWNPRGITQLIFHVSGLKLSGG